MIITINTFRYFILSACFVLLTSLSLANDAGSASRININTADVETLTVALKGVGPAKARAIIAYRENYGGFKSVDELEEVKGIGSSLVSINRERIVLE